MSNPYSIVIHHFLLGLKRDFKSSRCWNSPTKYIPFASRTLVLGLVLILGLLVRVCSTSLARNVLYLLKEQRNDALLSIIIIAKGDESHSDSHMVASRRMITRKRSRITIAKATTLLLSTLYRAVLGVW